MRILSKSLLLSVSLLGGVLSSSECHSGLLDFFWVGKKGSTATTVQTEKLAEEAVDLEKKDAAELGGKIKNQFNPTMGRTDPVLAQPFDDESEWVLVDDAPIDVDAAIAKDLDPTNYRKAEGLDLETLELARLCGFFSILSYLPHTPAGHAKTFGRIQGSGIFSNAEAGTTSLTSSPVKTRSYVDLPVYSSTRKTHILRRIHVRYFYSAAEVSGHLYHWIDDDTKTLHLCIAYHGSDTGRNWLTDLNMVQITDTNGILGHGGFYDGLRSSWDPENHKTNNDFHPFKNGQEHGLLYQLRLFAGAYGHNMLANKTGRKPTNSDNYPHFEKLHVHVTGHSLGGALAIQFCNQFLHTLKKMDIKKPNFTMDLFTFGAPKTIAGKSVQKVKQVFSDYNIKAHCFAEPLDPVSGVATATLLTQCEHIPGTLYYLERSTKQSNPTDTTRFYTPHLMEGTYLPLLENEIAKKRNNEKTTNMEKEIKEEQRKNTNYIAWIKSGLKKIITIPVNIGETAINALSTINHTIGRKLFRGTAKEEIIKETDLNFNFNPKNQMTIQKKYDNNEFTLVPDNPETFINAIIEERENIKNANNLFENEMNNKNDHNDGRIERQPEQRTDLINADEMDKIPQNGKFTKRNNPTEIDETKKQI